MSHANTYIGGGDNLAKTKWDSLRRAASASPHAAQLHLLGGLSDEQVETHFAQRRVFIAPLFNSTGIATKIVNSMGHGLPVTTTSDGIRGLGFISAKNDTSGEVPIDQTLCVANDADAFASCLCKLLMDDDAWTQASSAGLKHISHVLSPSAQRRSMRDAVLRRPLEKTEPDRKRG